MCDCTAGSTVFDVSKEHARTDQTETCLTACTLQTRARIIRNVGNHLMNDAASRHVLHAACKTDYTSMCDKIQNFKMVKHAVYIYIYIYIYIQGPPKNVYTL